MYISTLLTSLSIWTSSLFFLLPSAGALSSSPDAVGTYVADLVWTFRGRCPAINLTLGDKSVTVALDTGSSAFWVPEEDWQCVFNITGDIVHDVCIDFLPGLPVNNNFNFSGGQIPNTNFSATYIQDQGAIGYVGYQDVTFNGGFTVPNVTTGIATEYYSRPTSYYAPGIMGFAFAEQTAIWPSAQLADGATLDTLENITSYDPVVFQAAAEGLIAPLFGYHYDTMGKPDGSVCGQITFGGEPANVATGPYTPPVPVVARDTDSGPINFFWTVHVDGFKVLPPTPGAEPIVFSYLDDQTPIVDGTIVWGSYPPDAYTSHTMMVDTGNSASYIPPEVFNETIKHISPAPMVNQYGNWATTCDSNVTAPALAVTIGGVDLWFNTSGIVMPERVNRGEGSCELGVVPFQGDGLAVLGSTFLINVVTVHEFADLWNPTMKFAQRLW